MRVSPKEVIFISGSGTRKSFSFGILNFLLQIFLNKYFFHKIVYVKLMDLPSQILRVNL